MGSYKPNQTSVQINMWKYSKPKLGEEPPVLAGLEPLFQNCFRCLLTSTNNELKLHEGTEKQHSTKIRSKALLQWRVQLAVLDF